MTGEMLQICASWASCEVGAVRTVQRASCVLRSGEWRVEGVREAKAALVEAAVGMMKGVMESDEKSGLREARRCGEKRI